MPTCALTQANLTFPLLRTSLKTLTSSPDLAFPVFPAFLTACRAAIESARISIPFPWGPRSSASAIPATSPSHTIAPSPRYLPPSLGPAWKVSLAHPPAYIGRLLSAPNTFPPCCLCLPYHRGFESTLTQMDRVLPEGKPLWSY